MAVPAQVITLKNRQSFPEVGEDGVVAPVGTKSVPFHYYCRGMVLVDPDDKFKLGTTLRLICGRAGVYNDTPRFSK